LIDQSMGRCRLFKPILSVLIPCLISRGAMFKIIQSFAFIISQPMKFLATLARMIPPSPKHHITNQARLIPRARPHPIIWCAHGTVHMACLWCYRIVRIITAPSALVNVLLNGAIGESYNIGGHNEVKNLDVVHHICDALETLVPLENAKIKSYRDLITFVKDRPGHDRRYAIDATKIEKTLAFKPQETFESGMKKTIQWYLDNAPWWTEILDEKYDLKRIGEAS